MPSILDTTFSAIPLASNIFRELPEVRPGTKLSTSQIIERLFDSDFVYLIGVLFTRPLDDTEAEVIVEVAKVDIGTGGNGLKSTRTDGGTMVAAIAFACIRFDGMSVQRVEFTPEFKVCLPFLRFAGLGDEPLDTAPIEEDGAVRAGVEQHLRVAYTATASIALPSLVSLRYASGRGLTDPTICLRGFGICLQESDWPSDCPAAVDYWNEPHAVTRALDRLASVVDHAARNDEGGNAHRTARRGHSPFSFVEKTEDPFGNFAAREGGGDLKIVSERRVRALLLVELPSYGNKCHLRLYTGP